MQARNSQLPTCRHMFEEHAKPIMAIEAAALPLFAIDAVACAPKASPSRSSAKTGKSHDTRILSKRGRQQAMQLSAALFNTPVDHVDAQEQDCINEIQVRKKAAENQEVFPTDFWRQ